MSNQRQDNRRSDARQASSAQRQRRQGQKPSQAPKTAKARKSPGTTRAAQTGAAKKRSAAEATQAQQFIAPARTTAPKAARQTTGNSRRTDAPIKNTRTTKSAKKTSEPSATAATPAITPVAQMPDLPQTPQTPEIPELPETPEVPEMPETPDAPPDAPEIPSLPETPAEPEIPETPEVPEIPETPEPEQPQQPEQPSEPPEPVVPVEPTEPTEPPEPSEPPVRIEPEKPGEPTEPAQPDNPAVQAPDSQPQASADDILAAASEAAEPAMELAEAAEVTSQETTKADAEDTADTAIPAVPVATKQRRMPTLAAMNRTRRDESVSADGAGAALNADGADEVVADAQSDGTEASAHAGGSVTNQDAKSAVTRPVAARFSNRRRKAPAAPGFVWEGDPRLPYMPWPMRRRVSPRPHPLPAADAVVPVAVVHIFTMALLGLMGALQGLGTPGPLGSWLLVGALIVGVGGVLAYSLHEIEHLQRFAPIALLASQIGLLVWAMLLVGPRASLLVLVPALIEAAALMSDTLLASVFALVALLIYALFAGFSISLSFTPASAPSGAAALAFDVICVVVGLLAALWLLLAIMSGRERAQAIARARRHEADVLRNLMTQFRQEVQDDTGKLESALLQALKGQSVGAIPTEGMYRLLAETILDTAARLEVLQRDREERLRLEGALRVVVRAVERQWLGIEPEWPDPTGTAIDELVALLRSPRLDVAYQREAGTPSIAPRLIPIPTVAVERDTPPPTPISRPLSGSAWVAHRRRARRPELYPVPPTSGDSAIAEDGDPSRQ